MQSTQAMSRVEVPGPLGGPQQPGTTHHVVYLPVEVIYLPPPPGPGVALPAGVAAFIGGSCGVAIVLLLLAGLL